MTNPAHIVHLTPHLGGGVGKTLLTLVEAQKGLGFRHSFVLFERPEKTRSVDALRGLGCRIEFACDDPVAACELLRSADLVQLEWWNHPATFDFLCRTEQPPMRLLVWSHVSGLHTPVFPTGLIDTAGRFVFSSPCSLESAALAGLGTNARSRLGVVASGVGLDRPLPRTAADDGALRVGYLGSLNFSKLHPQFVDFLAAVDLPGFAVRVWGDVDNRQVLQNECRRYGKDELIAFEGFTTEVAACLASLDALAYLLNPAHYGTGENALIEAMSAGVVPVVLDNPAERAIVEHGRTGLIVDSPDAFAAAMRWLTEHPSERKAMGERARAATERRFAPRAMGEAMAAQYRMLLADDRRAVDFRRILGDTPADWFLSCHESGREFERSLSGLRRDAFARHSLHEPSKGSLRQFASRFPDDARLQAWAGLSAEGGQA